LTRRGTIGSSATTFEHFYTPSASRPAPRDVPRTVQAESPADQASDFNRSRVSASLPRMDAERAQRSDSEKTDSDAGEFLLDK
jgi:hypothetical protein